MTSSAVAPPTTGFTAGPGNDRVYGEEHNDTLYPGPGNDYALGSAGDDHVYGWGRSGGTYIADGEDTIDGGYENDVVEGGGVDVILGGSHDDVLSTRTPAITPRIFNGNNQFDIVYGSYGNDTIAGELGDDELHGSLGDDAIYGGGNEDRLYGEEGNDALFGETGVDQLFGGLGFDQLFGGPLADALDGGGDLDLCNGNDGTDFWPSVNPAHSATDEDPCQSPARHSPWRAAWPWPPRARRLTNSITMSSSARPSNGPPSAATKRRTACARKAATAIR